MNKRYHKLERIIRVEYDLFGRVLCSKSKRYEIIQHIANLMYYKIHFMFYSSMITLSERTFMINCNNIYFNNRINYIDKLC